MECVNFAIVNRRIMQSRIFCVCWKRITPSRSELQYKVNQFCDKYSSKLMLNDW